MARNEVGLGEVRKVLRGAATVIGATWQLSRVRTALMLSTAVLLGVLPVVVVVTNSYVIRNVGTVAREGMASSAGDTVIAAMVLLVGLFAARTVVTYAGGYLASAMARHLDADLRARTMRAAMTPAGVLHLEDPQMLRAFEAARNLSPMGMTPGLAVQSLGIVMAARIEPIGYVIVLAWLAWPLALAMAVITVLGHMEMHRLMMTQVRQAFIVDSPTDAFYFRDLALTPDAAKEVRVFGLGDWIGMRYRTSMLAFLEQSWRRRGLFSTTFFAIFAATAIAIGAGIVWFALAAARGDVGLGTAVLGLSLLLLLAPRVVPEDIQVAYGATAVPAILEAERVASSLDDELPGSSAADALPQRTITFANVCFAYPGSTQDVLHNLCLELRVGERTALVGVNGAGKTTIVKLLCRLYQPTSGVILVDGVPLDQFDAASWQRQLAVLFQDFVRYELTALDNVRLADPSSRVGAQAGPPVLAQQFHRLVARVGAEHIVEDLPSGWDTTLSSRYAGGVDLSGGQWQRIALARALYAVEQGACVLVLDEPTANLDVRAEAELYEQFIDLAASGRNDQPLITVLVSHRLSTVRRADRIVVLDGGVVVEDGTHDELVEHDGLYARMFHAQATRFVDAAPTTVIEDVS